MSAILATVTTVGWTVAAYIGHNLERVLIFKAIRARVVADHLQFWALAFGAYYGILFVVHPYVLGGKPGADMSAIAGGSALALTVIALFANRVPGIQTPHTVMFLIGSVPLFNSLAHLAVTGDLLQSTNVLIVIVGAGLLLQSTVHFIAFLVLAVGAWSVLLVQAGLMDDPRSSHWAFALAAVCTLAVFTYKLRRGMVREALELQTAVTDAEAAHRAERAKLELQTQLLQAEKLQSLGLLAGGVAHDFNNILVAVLGNLSLAMETLSTKDPAHAAVRRSFHAADRASELTRQMLAYAGDSGVRIRVVDMVQEIRVGKELLKAIVPSTAKLEFDLASEPVWVEADPAQLLQIALNLAVNSADSLGSEHGRIVVRVRSREVGREELQLAQIGQETPAGSFGVLAVSDNGPGIAPDMISRIFDPFFSSKGLGRGLGLSAVSGIMSSHDGAVLIESTPQESTTFSVLLALTTAPPQPDVAEPPRAATAQYSGAGRTVLVADDDHSILEVTKATLERAGYEVLLASDGEEAVGVARRHGPDLLILDYTMPRMTGPEVIRELTDFSGPIVLTSGYAAEAASADVRERIHAFLEKPYRFADLLAAAGRALEGTAQSSDGA